MIVSMNLKTNTGSRIYVCIGILCGFPIDIGPNDSQQIEMQLNTRDQLCGLLTSLLIASYNSWLFSVLCDPTKHPAELGTAPRTIR